MTAEFNRMGVHFLYPENWELSEDADGEPLSVTLQNEQYSGFVSGE